MLKNELVTLPEGTMEGFLGEATSKMLSLEGWQVSSRTQLVEGTSCQCTNARTHKGVAGLQELNGGGGFNSHIFHRCGN